MWARFPRATVAIEHSWVLARIRKRQARILRSETGSSFSWTTIGVAIRLRRKAFPPANREKRAHHDFDSTPRASLSSCPSVLSGFGISEPIDALFFFKQKTAYEMPK